MVGKAGDQALRRFALAEAISHLRKAIELSDKVGGAARPREGVSAASASEWLKLQTRYGQAVMWPKGYAAEETKAAFARAGELATEIGDAEVPLEAEYVRWAHDLWRGELGLARKTESFPPGGGTRGAVDRGVVCTSPSICCGNQPTEADAHRVSASISETIVSYRSIRRASPISEPAFQNGTKPPGK